MLVHTTGHQMRRFFAGSYSDFNKENENSNEGAVKVKSQKLGVKLPRGSIHVRKTSLVLFFSCVIDLMPDFSFHPQFQRNCGCPGCPVWGTLQRTPLYLEICLSNAFGFCLWFRSGSSSSLPKSRTLFPMTPEPSKQPYKELHRNPKPASTGAYA